MLFLKYSFVFPYSGLPAHMSDWKRTAARLVGDPVDWHQLDIHGSIYVVLDAESTEPVAVMLSRHHNARVFWPEDIPSWPGDDGVQVGFAAFSNEPHLMSPDGRQRWAPAAGDPSQVEFILGLTDKVPLTSGRDLVPGPRDGAVEIHPTLRSLNTTTRSTPRECTWENAGLCGGGDLSRSSLWPALRVLTSSPIRNSAT